MSTCEIIKSTCNLIMSTFNRRMIDTIGLHARQYIKNIYMFYQYFLTKCVLVIFVHIFFFETFAIHIIFYSIQKAYNYSE